AFIAENVSGLLRGVARGYFKRIMAALREPGYRVKCRLLSADWLGVPQTRDRAIFVGVRDDLAAEPAFPKPFPYKYTLSDVVPGCLRVEAAGYGKMHVDDAARTPARTITASGYSAYAESYQLVMSDGTRRKFTLDEVKAICSFPPDYILTGNYRAGWTRLGNSVPPFLMRAVASTVRDEILGKS
ncbi:MAG: DNA cytosine methyltransferase, partial [Methanocella sp.]